MTHIRLCLKPLFLPTAANGDLLVELKDKSKTRREVVSFLHNQQLFDSINL